MWIIYQPEVNRVYFETWLRLLCDFQAKLFYRNLIPEDVSPAQYIK